MIQAVIVVLFGIAAGWLCGCLIRHWLDRPYPLSMPSLPPLAPPAYWGGPKDGEAIPVGPCGIMLYGEYFLGGVYRFDVARNAYVWHERRLPAVDWSDLERGEW